MSYNKFSLITMHANKPLHANSLNYYNMSLLYYNTSQIRFDIASWDRYIFFAIIVFAPDLLIESSLSFAIRE